MEVLQLAATTSPPRIIYLMYMVAAPLNKSFTFLWIPIILPVHKKVKLLFKSKTFGQNFYFCLFKN